MPGFPVDGHNYVILSSLFYVLLCKYVTNVIICIANAFFGTEPCLLHTGLVLSISYYKHTMLYCVLQILILYTTSNNNKTFINFFFVGK